MSKFKDLNPNIEWDHSNYLVDLSGFYSKCSNVGKKGEQKIQGLHPDTQKSISALVDYTKGDLRHVKAVDDYLRVALPSWITTSPFREAIKGAEKFGCSVKPGCAKFLSFSCLFSPGLHGVAPTPPPTRPPTIPTTPEPHELGDPTALAFTKEQYSIAEKITGIQWDRSNFLENLSGTEASCNMVGKSSWDFSKSIKESSLRRLKVRGEFGYTENRGNTTAALRTILTKKFSRISTEMIGCSTIPHCIRSDQMWVIVVCIYSENKKESWKRWFWY